MNNFTVLASVNNESNIEEDDHRTAIRGRRSLVFLSTKAEVDAQGQNVEAFIAEIPASAANTVSKHVEHESFSESLLTVIPDVSTMLYMD